MNTNMIVRDERDRSTGVIVILSIGAMLLAGALVLALVWSGAIRLEGAEAEARAESQDAYLGEAVAEWLARHYAREAAARDGAGGSYSAYAEQYYEAALALEAAPDVVEMERYQEVIAADREFTYTTADAVEQGRRAAEALVQGSGNVVEMERYLEVIAADREFTYTTAEAVEQGRRAAAAFWRVWETVATGRVR